MMRKKPKFKRSGLHKIKRLKNKWRKPRGRDNKVRLRRRDFIVQAGYGSPKKNRNIHPSGFSEIMIYNTDDLEKVDPKKEVARIGSNVGKKKRIGIIKKSSKMKIKILNPGKRVLEEIKKKKIAKERKEKEKIKNGKKEKKVEKKTKKGKKKK